jgi:hypothetical protein
MCMRHTASCCRRSTVVRHTIVGMGALLLQRRDGLAFGLSPCRSVTTDASTSSHPEHLDNPGLTDPGSLPPWASPWPHAPAAPLSRRGSREAHALGAALALSRRGSREEGQLSEPELVAKACLANAFVAEWSVCKGALPRLTQCTRTLHCVRALFSLWLVHGVWYRRAAALTRAPPRRRRVAADGSRPPMQLAT